MEQNTQQWPLKFYHETGALGVFLFLPFAFLLGFWWAQQFWAALFMTLVGLALIVYRGRKKQAHQPFTHLGYNSLQGWYLVRHVVGDTHVRGAHPTAVEIEHLWFGPFFCTLRLRLGEEAAATHRRLHVVCWQVQMSAVQWRHLRILLRSIQFGGRANAQSMKDQT